MSSYQLQEGKAAVLRMVHPKTDGDWILLELESGEEYRVTGPRLMALSNQLLPELDDVEVDESLISRDPKGRGTAQGTPAISSIQRKESSTEATAFSENHEYFLLDLIELKTLLLSKR